MAGKSLLPRAACTPTAQIFGASGLCTKAQISLSFPSDRENANNFAKTPPSLTASAPVARLGRASVCRIPRRNTDAPSVEVLDADQTESPAPAAAGLETTRAALRGSFETQAAVGRVECNGRGCRPIFADAVAPAALPDGWLSQEDAPEVLESRTAVYHSRSRRRDVETSGRPKPHFPKDFAQFLDEVWMEKGAAEKYFAVALQAAPGDPKLLCEYAAFSWKSLQDTDKAEALYRRALEQAPDDADVLASYALFLWLTDS